MIANKRFYPPIILFGVFLIGVLCLTACNNSGSSNGFKSLTVDNEIASYSFEYRDYYEDIAGPYIQDSATQRYTSVTILAPKKTDIMINPETGSGTVGMEYVPAYIEIIAADASKYSDWPASVRINNSITDWGKWPNFQLLERFNTSVSGVEAEFIAYEVDGFVAGADLKYCTQVSFDYNGLQWDIMSEADIDMADMVRADFDHIIETFEILE